MSFLVDFLGFEAARSSKVAIFGLWIGPNSILGWRESLWRVVKKKRKKSNKLAWFYYMHTPFVRKIVSNPSVFLSSGSCMNENVVFIDNIFRPLCSHFFISDRSQWCPQLPSNKTDKYLLTRFPVLIWSFYIVFSLLKSSYFFFERGRRPMIRLADSYKNPTEELEL